MDKKKYGNQKVNLDGYWFDSKLEASLYHLLKLRMYAGEIESIQCQDQVKLGPTKTIYRPDFKCKMSDGSYCWVEAKGFETAKWPLVKKLWKFHGPGKLEIWKGSHLKPYLHEEILRVPTEDEQTIAHLRSKIEELQKELEALKAKLPVQDWAVSSNPPPPDSL